MAEASPHRAQAIRDSLHCGPLDKTMRLNIFLPAGYAIQISCPVIYILERPAGNQDSWPMKSATIQRLGDDPAYSHHQGTYEDYIRHDIIPYIDAHYSTIADASGRVIGSDSMGELPSSEKSRQIGISSNRKKPYSRALAGPRRGVCAVPCRPIGRK